MADRFMLSDAVASRVASMKDRAAIVYWYLAARDHMGFAGEPITVPKLAAELGRGVRTVRRGLAELRRAELLSPGRGVTSVILQ